MIVLYVVQATGEIKFWKEAGLADIALRSPPTGEVVVVADRFPNYVHEAYVDEITRAPELDLPYVPIEFYTGHICTRCPPRRGRASFAGTGGFSTVATGGRFLAITSFAAAGALGTAGTVSDGSP